jgi:hypothetical protein
MCSSSAVYIPKKYQELLDRIKDLKQEWLNDAGILSSFEMYNSKDFCAFF